MKINLDRPFNIPARRVRVRELADELLAARAVIKVARQMQRNMQRLGFVDYAASLAKVLAAYDASVGGKP
jgi:hypothetical protein